MNTLIYFIIGLICSIVVFLCNRGKCDCVMTQETVVLQCTFIIFAWPIFGALYFLSICFFWLMEQLSDERHT
jgi:hypothetical protein